MSPRSRLENIIHKLDSAHLPDIRNMPASRIVIVDVNSGQVFTKPPLLGMLRDLHYYLVRSTTRGVDCEGLVYPLKSTARQQCLDVRLDYTARCRKGSEEKAVAALCLGGSITQNFHELLASWMDEFILDKKEQMIDIAANFDQYRQEMSRHIARRCEATTGLIIEVSVEIDGDTGNVSEFVEIDYALSCRINDSSNVRIVHHLLLTIEDLGRFHLSKVVDVQEWTQTVLDRVSRMVLFDISYLDILHGRGPAEIKEEVRRLVQEIGYSVKQMSVIPDLDPLRWKDGVNVDLLDETFVTMDSRIRVRLDIILSGKIINLHHLGLTRYLKPQARDIRDDIADVVSKHVQQVMHSVDPEHFYTNFYKRPGTNGRPVREILELAIADTLRDTFAFEDISIILKPLETELSERLAELQGKLYSVEIETTPLRERGQQDKVRIRIHFDILGVHEGRWYEFSAKQYETIELHRDALCSFFREDIEGKLSTTPSNILQFSDIQTAEKLKERVVQASVRNVRNVFGLEIRVVNLSRDETYAEREAGKARFNVIDDQWSTLGVLLEMRRTMSKDGIPKNDPDFIDVEKKIARIKADWPGIEKSLPEALPQGDTSFSFDDYEQIGAIKPANRQIEEDNSGKNPQPQRNKS